MTTKTEAIRALNDDLRQNLSAGTALITPGIAALGAEAVARIVKTIAVYDDFCHANDPYEEHDFGSFDKALAFPSSMARRSFSRSIITIKRSLFTRPTRLIRRSPSGSLRSCSPKSTELR